MKTKDQMIDALWERCKPGTLREDVAAVCEAGAACASCGFNERALEIFERQLSGHPVPMELLAFGRSLAIERGWTW